MLVRKIIDSITILHVCTMYMVESTCTQSTQGRRHSVQTKTISFIINEVLVFNIVMLNVVLVFKY